MFLTTPYNPSLTDQMSSRSIPTASNESYIVEFDRSADLTIGILLAVMLVVLIPGNMAAFSYFWPIRHKSVPFKLYPLVIGVDILTGLSTVPVTVSLLNDREPILFADPSFCGIHLVTVNFLIRFSMFLVAVMSMSRAIAVVAPYKMKDVNSTPFIFKLSLIITAYSFSMIFIDVAFLLLRWTRTKYRASAASCDLVTTENGGFWAMAYYRVAVQIEIALPPVFVFIAITASILTLQKKRVRATVNRQFHVERRVRQVSITIALFSAIFLLCNAPGFVYYMLQMLVFYSPSAQEKLADILYVKTVWYGNLMIVYLPVVLNATLNPCMYLLRMPSYYTQFVNISRDVSRRASSAVSHLAGRRGRQTTGLELRQM